MQIEAIRAYCEPIEHCLPRITFDHHRPTYTKQTQSKRNPSRTIRKIAPIPSIIKYLEGTRGGHRALKFYANERMPRGEREEKKTGRTKICLTSPDSFLARTARARAVKINDNFPRNEERVCPSSSSARRAHRAKYSPAIIV